MFGVNTHLQVVCIFKADNHSFLRTIEATEDRNGFAKDRPWVIPKKIFLRGASPGRMRSDIICFRRGYYSIRFELQILRMMHRRRAAMQLSLKRIYVLCIGIPSDIKKPSAKGLYFICKETNWINAMKRRGDAMIKEPCLSAYLGETDARAQGCRFSFTKSVGRNCCLAKRNWTIRVGVRRRATSANDV